MGGGNPIKKVVKTVTKPVEQVVKEVERVAESVGKEAERSTGKVVDEVGRTPGNLATIGAGIVGGALGSGEKTKAPVIPAEAPEIANKSSSDAVTEESASEIKKEDDDNLKRSTKRKGVRKLTIPATTSR